MTRSCHFLQPLQRLFPRLLVADLLLLAQLDSRQYQQPYLPFSRAKHVKFKWPQNDNRLVSFWLYLVYDITWQHTTFEPLVDDILDIVGCQASTH